jgi:hypothetical protein
MKEQCPGSTSLKTSTYHKSYSVYYHKPVWNKEIQNRGIEKNAEIRYMKNEKLWDFKT